MVGKTAVSLIVLFFLIFSCGQSFAKDPINVTGEVHDVWDNIYDRARFDSTDVNKDGYLDLNELKNEQTDFEYYRDNERYKHGDTDKDGRISLEEAKAEKKFEEVHRVQLAKEAFSDLQKKHPNADFSDVKWLKNHPEVSSALYNNAFWLEQHRGVAEKIAKDANWLNKNRKVAETIYGNRRWLAKNPQIAKEIYRNRKFLNNNRGLTKETYKRLKNK